MFSKNIAIVLALVLFLILGGALGYWLGNNKSADPKSPNGSPNNPPASSSIKPAKANLTADEAYNLSASEAAAWASDAHLAEINLASEKFGADGLASGWKIAYYSKTKGKSYEILIKDGESRGGKERAAQMPVQTLKGEFIDSSALAKSFFGLYPADTEIINLKMYFDSGSKKFMWTVFFPKGSHTIDAEI